MARLKGTLLVVLGILLLAVSAWAVLSRVLPILPGLVAVVKGGAPYPWGRLAGGIVAVVLFFILGRKALAAGRTRLDASGPEQGNPREIFKRRMAHWGLFLTLAFTVPVFFFLVQIVLVAPLAAIAWISLRSELAFLVFGAIHILIFAPILWGLSSLAVRGLMRLPNPTHQVALYLAAIGSLIFIAWLGPYSVGGHSNDQTYTWLQTFHPY